MTAQADVDEATLDDELDDLDELYEEPRSPLAGYPCPVTRQCKPYAVGRPMVDLPPL